MVQLLLAFAMASTPPRIALPGLDGAAVKVLPSSSKRGVVCFFVLQDCPISNAFAPEMNRIATDYKAKGWQFYLVHVDQSPAIGDLKKHHHEYGYGFPAVTDARQSLTALAGATKVPEAAVFSPKGELLYCGRIDDRYFGLSQKRPAPRVRDLREALDAITANRKPRSKRTEVIGCFIPKN